MFMNFIRFLNGENVNLIVEVVFTMLTLYKSWKVELAAPVCRKVSEQLQRIQSLPEIFIFLYFSTVLHVI